MHKRKVHTVKIPPQHCLHNHHHKQLQYYGHCNHHHPVCVSPPPPQVKSSVILSNLSLNVLILIKTFLLQCFFPFNNESMGYPVCAAEMKARMDAAVDSITCMRRSNRFALSLSGALKYCDPLGDKNVIVTMKSLPQNETRENKSVILIGVRVSNFK